MSSKGRFVQGRPGRRLGCTRGLHASARSAWSPGALVALLRRRKPEDYCEEALSRVRIKDYLGAVDTLNRALAIAPDYAMAHHLRGLSLSELGRHRRALAEFRQAIALDPAMTYVQYQIALQLNFLGENAEALEATDLAATLVPGDTAPLILRGSILFDLQRYDEALAAFGTALERDPGSGPVHYNRAQILRRLGRYDEALADYDEALRVPAAPPGAGGLGEGPAARAPPAGCARAEGHRPAPSGLRGRRARDLRGDRRHGRDSASRGSASRDRAGRDGGRVGGGDLLAPAEPEPRAPPVRAGARPADGDQSLGIGQHEVHGVLRARPHRGRRQPAARVH